MSSLTGAMGTTPGVMAATHDGGARVDRIARYKEERRRQIAQQQLANANSQQPNPASPRRYITRAKSAAPSSPANGDRSRVIPAAAGIWSGDVSSGSDSVTVRTTRASRLRAARLGTAGDAGSPAKKNGAPTTPDVKECRTVEEFNQLMHMFPTEHPAGIHGILCIAQGKMTDAIDMLLFVQSERKIMEKRKARIEHWRNELITGTNVPIGALTIPGPSSLT